MGQVDGSYVAVVDVSNRCCWLCVVGIIAFPSPISPSLSFIETAVVINIAVAKTNVNLTATYRNFLVF